MSALRNGVFQSRPATRLLSISRSTPGSSLASYSMSVSTSPTVSAPRAKEPKTYTPVTQSACGPPAQTVSSRAVSAAVAFSRGMQRPVGHWSQPTVAPTGAAPRHSVGDQRRPRYGTARRCLRYGHLDEDAHASSHSRTPRPPWPADGRVAERSTGTRSPKSTICRAFGRHGAVPARPSSPRTPSRQRMGPRRQLPAQRLARQPVKNPSGRMAGE